VGCSQLSCGEPDDAIRVVRECAVGSVVGGSCPHLILSRVSMASIPALGFKSGILSPGLLMAAMRKAHARPKTTISRREFAPVKAIE
jgi:hypothetical protein